MKTKSKSKRLKKKLDKVFSLWIRARDGKCVTCGSRQRLQNGHLLTRAALSTRWDELNCNCQCQSCNYTHEFRPHIYTEWFIDKYGLKTYKALIRQHNTVKKWTDRELEDLITKYKI